jgi:adenylate kinase
MIALFFGPPGSGKGTQAQKLRDLLSIPHLSTGDMFRAAIAARTPLGTQVEGILKRGDLVPDSVTLQMLKERIQEKDCERGFMLDGFPRNLSQAADLDKMLAGRRQKVDVAILFDVDHEEVIRRLSSRRTCGQCGKVISLLFDTKCTNCGSSDLKTRPDDQADVVRKRLQVYDDQTAPLVDYYRRAQTLKVLDANRDPAIITQELKGLLGG